MATSKNIKTFLLSSPALSSVRENLNIRYVETVSDIFHRDLIQIDCMYEKFIPTQRLQHFGNQIIDFLSKTFSSCAFILQNITTNNKNRAYISMYTQGVLRSNSSSSSSTSVTSTSCPRPSRIPVPVKPTIQKVPASSTTSDVDFEKLWNRPIKNDRLGLKTSEEVVNPTNVTSFVSSGPSVSEITENISAKDRAVTSLIESMTLRTALEETTRELNEKKKVIHALETQIEATQKLENQTPPTDDKTFRIPSSEIPADENLMKLIETIVLAREEQPIEDGLTSFENFVLVEKLEPTLVVFEILIQFYAIRKLSLSRLKALFAILDLMVLPKDVAGLYTICRLLVVE